MQLVTPQELFKLNNLELIAKQVVEGFIIGLPPKSISWL